MRIRLALVVVALVSLLPIGCTIEATLRTRTFQGPYDGFKDKSEADALALAESLLRAGKQDADVLDALRAQGFTDAQARRILALAILSLPQPK